MLGIAGLLALVPQIEDAAARGGFGGGGFHGGAGLGGFRGGAGFGGFHGGFARAGFARGGFVGVHPGWRGGGIGWNGAWRPGWRGAGLGWNGAWRPGWGRPPGWGWSPWWAWRRPAWRWAAAGALGFAAYNAFG